MLDNNDVWADDLLGRQPEAKMIADFIVGASEQARSSATGGAITLAIDAGYGEGKTFFLHRLSKQLSRHHPVAFVDAWTDDIADDPLSALVATLKRAIEPLAQQGQDGEVDRKFKVVLEKTGRLAKIAGTGLLKRALGLAITGAAVEAASDVFSGVTDELQEAVQANLQESGRDAIDGMSEAISARSLSLMEQRVREFEAGRAAMTELKQGLTALVGSLDDAGLKPPIVIIVDELDRCRPTYAIKLLEEIKHLFDVPGIVFIFGIHSSALSHSVRAAYGADFDGAAYLRRFIQRRYRLAEPSHDSLIAHLLSLSGIPENVFSYPRVKTTRASVREIPFSVLLSEYTRVHDVSARDARELVGMLETAVALSQGQRLIGPLLIPLAIGQIKGLPTGELPQATKSFNFNFFVQSGDGWSEYAPERVAEWTLIASKMSWHDLADKDGRKTFYENSVFNTMTGNDAEPLWAACKYPTLLAKVAMLERK